MESESSSSDTRESLLARARSREDPAWRELIGLYSPLVAYWCRRCGFDSATIADCIQEVFSSVARHLADYRPHGTQGSFRAWLWTITRNKARDIVRRNYRSPQGVGGSSAWCRLSELPDESAIPDDEPSEITSIQELTHRAMEQVRDQFAAATWQSFWRCAVDGLPTALVAQELSLTESAVRQNRSRVLRRLRQQLRDVE